MKACYCCGRDEDDRFCSCGRLTCELCGKCNRHCECFIPKLRDRNVAMSNLGHEPSPAAVPQGEVGRCRGTNCQATIYWRINESTGRRQPFDADGTPHHATCPDVENFRRKR